MDAYRDVVRTVLRDSGLQGQPCTIIPRKQRPERADQVQIAPCIFSRLYALSTIHYHYLNQLLMTLRLVKVIHIQDAKHKYHSRTVAGRTGSGVRSRLQALNAGEPRLKPLLSQG